MDAKSAGPKKFFGVMVSSTFTDLKDHRAALIKALAGQDLHPVMMENDSAKPAGDVLDSSLEMVAKSAAYIGVISHKYGQIPDDAKRNPDRLSLTQLEFNEAIRLDRPILLFLMGPDHAVKPADVEVDQEGRKKLEAFRETAKRFRPDSNVHRVYKVFNNLQEFEVAATQSVSELPRHLAQREGVVVAADYDSKNSSVDAIPRPPAFYAEPPYAGSHALVGRRSELETLNDWALAADQHPILLFEAIGGTGKSLLTWEWINKYSTEVREDWAGRFWYSFYERGAIMADFCRRALAYMTGRPPEEFQKKKTPELGELLLRQLRSRPWLLVLDGLERVLVSYHRLDASQMVDEEAGTSDQIVCRDPCSAIRFDDDDLLRTLAAAGPSKLLISSRLVPRVLLSAASQPIPGVRRVPLEGLRPVDAEAMFRGCGVLGDGAAMQNYLKSNCDCHPLVVGALAGLIVKDHRWDRGNFDAWSQDPLGGGQLDLGRLDLVQRRNHIILSAVEILPDKSKELLSTLALVSGGVDNDTLAALNPHLPEPPVQVPMPWKPEAQADWSSLPEDLKKFLRDQYSQTLLRRKEYEAAVTTWRRSSAVRQASLNLNSTIRDLEERGLLQYDPASKRHDLHPVVRGVVAGTLKRAEKDKYGEKLVDHFSRQEHPSLEYADTLGDAQASLNLVRTFLQMGRFSEAFAAYRGDLAVSLSANLEAAPERLAILRSFFPEGWESPPEEIGEIEASYLVNERGNALRALDLRKEAAAAYSECLRILLGLEDWANLASIVRNFANLLRDQNQLAQEERARVLAVELCSCLQDPEYLFVNELSLFGNRVCLGRWADAEVCWQRLQNQNRPTQRAIYRFGEAEFQHAQFLFYRGCLTEGNLAAAERLAHKAKSRSCLRDIIRLRGEWLLQQGRWSAATESFDRALVMAREVGQTDPKAEAGLVLSRIQLQLLPDAQQEVEQLSRAREPWNATISRLWLLIGDRERAKEHAIRAYQWAWADGEPYVHRYYLDQARALLESLGEMEPDLPPYDPVKSEKLPYEDEVVAVIARLKAERAEKVESAKPEA